LYSGGQLVLDVEFIVIHGFFSNEFVSHQEHVVVVAVMLNNLLSLLLNVGTQFGVELLVCYNEGVHLEVMNRHYPGDGTVQHSKTNSIEVIDVLHD